MRKTIIAFILSITALVISIGAAVYLANRQMEIAHLRYLADRKVMQARLELVNVSDVMLIQQQITIDWSTYHAPVYDVQTSIGIYGVAYDFDAFYSMVSSADEANNYVGPLPLPVYYFIKDTGSSVDYAFWTNILVNNTPNSTASIDALWGNGKGR
jgi:hypothetical protein